jgi:glutamate/tyrosine decarboxylase-like PLP-dependent enzyme
MPLPMHSLTEANEQLARDVFALALERRRNAPPLNEARSADELLALQVAITEHGIGGAQALALFNQHVAPASVSNDHPGFLAYIPNAPTEASIYADWLLSAFPTFAGAWQDGAGVIAAENAALHWLSGLLGWPEHAGGCFMPGATLGTLSALHVARHVARQNCAQSAEPVPQRWAVLASSEAHACVAAATRVMDVDLVKIETDADWRLQGVAVHEALAREGTRVCAVVASAGATNLGVIDDLPGIAAACREAGVWLHVDAAYGGAVLASPTHRHLLAGIEAADSCVIDPHKWLFAPYDCCALLYRHPALAVPAHAQHADYLDTPRAVVVDAATLDPMRLGIHLSRRGRGFPFWFSLATYGTAAYADAIDAAMALAQTIAAEISAQPLLELVAQPQLSVVVFRRTGWDLGQTQAWSDAMQRTGLAIVMPTRVMGAPAFRLCVLNPRVTLEQVRAVLATLG